MLLRLIMVGRSTPQRWGDEVRARIKKNRKTSLSSNLLLHPMKNKNSHEQARNVPIAWFQVITAIMSGVVAVETIRPKRIGMKMPPMAYEKHGARLV
jgi:hypothetical protein